MSLIVLKGALMSISVIGQDPELTEADDAELVVATLAGNTRAFDVLVLRYRRAMLTVAQQIVKKPEDAEDVVQDSLLRAFESLPQLTDLNRFGAWLHSITRNRALRFYKNTRRYQPQEDMEPYLHRNADMSATDPARIVERELTQQAIRDAVQELPEEFRIVIELYYWAEMPQKRMAEFLSIPLTTVKWRLRRAKDRLKAVLAERGYGTDIE